MRDHDSTWAGRRGLGRRRGLSARSLCETKDREAEASGYGSRRLQHAGQLSTLLATAGSECDIKLTPLKFSKLPRRLHKEGTCSYSLAGEFVTNRVAVSKSCVTNCPPVC